MHLFIEEATYKETRWFVILYCQWPEEDLLYWSDLWIEQTHRISEEWLWLGDWYRDGRERQVDRY